MKRRIGDVGGYYLRDSKTWVLPPFKDEPQREYATKAEAYQAALKRKLQAEHGYAVRHYSP